MCGRYTQTVDIKTLAREFKIPASDLPDLRKSFNITPQSAILTISKKRNQESAFDIMQWGLVPSWAKDPEIGNRMINARAETIAEKPSFRGPFKNSRCLIPADGFYEWKLEGKVKTPYYIRMKSRLPFTFAGIASDWTGPDGSEIKSAAIITGEPNSLMTPIHKRMPMIIPGAKRDEWLDPNQFKTPRLQAMLEPYPSEMMEAFPVSRFVNSPGNDSPDCIIPAQ